jgi:hypothetical protein
MKEVTLQFSTILEMLDFEKTARTFGRIKDYYSLTIKGYFREVEIEVAKTGYKAIVIEE